MTVREADGGRTMPVSGTATGSGSQQRPDGGGRLLEYPAARPSISVIICAYTTLRFRVLQAAVTAVRDQLSERDELLVVIDHSDELLRLARTTLSPAEATGGDARAGSEGHANGREGATVRLVENDNRRGLSGARNAGVAAAHGELVVFLDDDAIPREDWLARLAEPFADPDVIGAGGVAIPIWEGPRPGWLPEEFLWVVGCSYRGLPQKPSTIRNPIGANMAFRRSAIQRAGGFTDGIGRVRRTPLGCEETELSIRATRLTGGRIVQQPAARVDHLVTKDRLRPGYFLRRCWAEGISKAVVASMTGGDAALASERSYVTRILTTGVAAGLTAGLRGDVAALQRVGAIVVGFALTAAGYVRGALAGLRSKRAQVEPRASDDTTPQFVPTWSGQLELTAPALPEIVADTDGNPLEFCRILVRAAGTPIGFVELEAPAGSCDPARAVALAEAALAARRAPALADTAWTAQRTERVSVILCTRNRAAGARRTLLSLLALRHRNLEIIVVDNDPADDATQVMVDELARVDDRVRYVREAARGLSCARNRGLREASGEFIAFTDDDVRVDPLWVNGLLRGFDRQPGVACVTGLVASASLVRPAEQYFDRRVWWSSSCEPRLFGSRRSADDPPLHPYTAGRFGTGANFAARLDELRSLGGFDECLGAGSASRGGEDLDIFVRLIRAGHLISYEPSALVWHEHRIDQGSLRQQMYAYGLGLTAYLAKHLLAPGSGAALLRRIPGGIWQARLLLRRSRKAVSDAALDNSGMTAVELRGMLVGPLVYLRARRGADPEHVRSVAP